MDFPELVVSMIWSSSAAARNPTIPTSSGLSSDFQFYGDDTFAASILSRRVVVQRRTLARSVSRNRQESCVGLLHFLISLGGQRNFRFFSLGRLLRLQYPQLVGNMQKRPLALMQIRPSASSNTQCAHSGEVAKRGTTSIATTLSPLLEPYSSDAIGFSIFEYSNCVCWEPCGVSSWRKQELYRPCRCKCAHSPRLSFP